MTGLQPLSAYITPPNPNVQSEIPACYIWPARGRESRDTSRLRAGTVPRIAVPGGPSGTKPAEHVITAWMVWMMSTDDPDADILFPGMTWAVQEVFRSAAYGVSGQVAADPVTLTDPWTGETSYLVDLGEEQSWEYYDKLLEDQRFMRLDAVLLLPVTEVLAF
jgi:hypothetical protein